MLLFTETIFTEQLMILILKSCFYYKHVLL